MNTFSCETCKTKGRLLMLGGLHQECPECAGVGYVQIGKCDSDEIKATVIKKKRKRKYIAPEIPLIQPSV